MDEDNGWKSVFNNENNDKKEENKKDIEKEEQERKDKIDKEKKEELNKIIEEIKEDNIEESPEKKVEEEKPETTVTKTTVHKVRRRHVKKESGLLQFLTKHRIMILAIGIALIIISTVFILISTSSTESGKKVEMGKRIKMKSPINNYVIMATEVKTNVVVSRNNSTARKSLRNKSEQFTKIKIMYKNKKKSTVTIWSINEFNLLDSSNSIIADCYTADEMYEYVVSDALPSSVMGKETVEGYLYCKTENTTFGTLQIKSYSSIDQTAASKGEIIGTTANTYYIDLNK